MGASGVALKLLHTADWHLGKRFPGFAESAQQTLQRARLEVLDKVFGVAQQNNVDAVLCAGDLFDDPYPEAIWWEGLLARLAKTPPGRPIYLLPGNHDALMKGSVWTAGSAFRLRLPKHALVVDKANSTFALRDNAVLIASPCFSQAGQEDLALALPAREAGDERIRVGMVHGTTFEMPDFQANFPIAQDAAVRRGFDYLAIGDTHGFRIIPPGAATPIVYPGAPEQTRFEEKDAGSVALVLIRSNRQVTVEQQRVASWKWEETTIRSISELRQLAARSNLRQCVMRLRLELSLGPAEFDEAEKLVEQLRGTDAIAPLVGILQLEDAGLCLDARDLSAAFESMPEAVKETARRLKALDTGPNLHGSAVVQRALYHLYMLSKKVG
jgi:DNA repair exonuclease SbcCD nuclease subunit